MAAPTLLVEFGYNKSGVDYVWNDISAYVRNVSIGRGVSREIDQYSAGSATIILSNNDRRFDPTYSSSPYYGQVKPAGAIRVTAGGYTQFYGFIDSWSFDYPEQGFDATATVTAFDGLSNLAKTLLDSTYNVEQYTGSRIQYILNKNEVYWNSTLTDLDGGNSTVWGDTVNQADNKDALSYIQQVAKSEPGDFFISRDGKATFRDRRYLTDSWNAPTYRHNYCMVPSFESGTTFYWTGVTQSTAITPYVGSYVGAVDFNSSIIRRIATYSEGDGTKYVAGQNYIASMYVYSVGSANVYLQLDLMNGSGTVATVNSTTAVPSNTWTRISTPVNTTASTIDGVYVYVDNGAFNSNNFYIDAIQIEPVATLDTYFDGTFTPANDGTKRYTSRWLGSVNKSTSKLETSTLKSNPSILTPIAFSDYSGTDIPYSDVKVTYNSENLFNKIVLSNTQSPVITKVKEDTTLQTLYGVRAYGAADYLIPSAKPNQLDNIAGELLSVYGNPELRVEQMELQVHGLTGAQQSTVLAMDMRQLVQITFKPARIGTQMVKKYVVIGINQRIDKDKTYVMTFTVASIDYLPFHLNSAMLGVLNTNVLSY